MSALKSIFISSYMMLTMVITIYAGWMLLQGNPLAWIGVMMTTTPFLMVISWLMIMRNIARTPDRLLLLSVIGAIGVGLAGFFGYLHAGAMMPLMLALVGWIGFLFYDYWYAHFDRQANTQIRVGSTLPVFSLRDIKGKRIASSELVAGKPSILIFYRGNWCPLCMAQIREIAQQYQTIESQGIRVALISPQPHCNTLGLALRHKVSFEYLTDEGNVAARILGIDDPYGLPMGMQMLGYSSETVMPTVIITDQQGQVIWTHETDNYRVRLEPSLFIDVLRQHGIDMSLR